MASMVVKKSQVFENIYGTGMAHLEHHDLRRVGGGDRQLHTGPVADVVPLVGLGPG